MKRVLLGLLASLGVASHAQQVPPVVKISVYSSGVVHLNGKPASLGEVTTEVNRVKQLKGEVWYFREKPRGDPPPIMFKVLDIIGEAKMPMSFSSKPDFSDYVDLQTGESKPRKMR